ncbi:MAG TPA: aminoacyl-tRNA hydrolase [Candidatus Paceibacterota bacterium]
MTYIIVGLGNPGEEYKDTRHNVGRMALDAFRTMNDLSEWEERTSLKALVSEGKLKKHTVMLVEPETFMNKSGDTVGKIKEIKFKTKDKQTTTENLVVVHDDLDLPLGRMKISFNKSSGGHKGVESVIKAIKTEGFTRVRIGISPSNAKGVVKKPDDVVGDFIVEPFKPKELEAIKKEMKQVVEAISMLVLEGREKAMGEFNRS